jgi:hypothetical protein
MKPKIRIFCVLGGLIMVLLFTACGTVASVRPIGKGKSGLTLASAGPVAPLFGVDMPIPYAVLRYRRGLNDNTDIHCGIHATMLYLGNLGVDAGLTKHLLEHSSLYPALALEGSVYFLYHLNVLSTIRAFPELSVIGRYDLLADRHAVYFGSHALVQYNNPYIIIAPFIGFEFNFSHFGLNLEGKWYAPTEDTEFRVVDYKLKPFDHGAVGFAWGFSYRF